MWNRALAGKVAMFSVLEYRDRLGAGKRHAEFADGLWSMPHKMNFARLDRSGSRVGIQGNQIYDIIIMDCFSATLRQPAQTSERVTVTCAAKEPGFFCTRQLAKDGANTRIAGNLHTISSI